MESEESCCKQNSECEISGIGLAEFLTDLQHKERLNSLPISRCYIYNMLTCIHLTIPTVGRKNRLPLTLAKVRFW